MQGGKKKLDFAEREKCKPVLLSLSLAGNLEKHPWDRMEGAWLWYQIKLCTIQNNGRAT
jgi:hypothetical protein